MGQRVYSRVGAENIEDEPGTFYSTRKQGRAQRMMGTHQKAKRPA